MHQAEVTHLRLAVPLSGVRTSIGVARRFRTDYGKPEVILLVW